MTGRAPWVLAVAATVLLASIGLLATGRASLPSGDRTHPRDVNHLVRLLPRDLPGWTSRSVPIGPTEAASDAAAGALNFDAMFYRSYSQADRTFTLYAAYWSPGRMPVKMVAGHTPDVCWVANGWIREALRHDCVEHAGPITLRPAEWRRMRLPGLNVTRYVLYWHLVNGRRYVQNRYFGAIPSPVDYWREVMLNALHGPPEQIFVRLSSSVPFRELSSDSGFQTLAAALHHLALTRRPAHRPKAANPSTR